jgi:hypothetical protein
MRWETLLNDGATKINAGAGSVAVARGEPVLAAAAERSARAFP